MLSSFRRATIGVGTLVFVASLISACAHHHHGPNLVAGDFPKAEEEIRAFLDALIDDVNHLRIENFAGHHLDSKKFTKFGPRAFERQDIHQTNESEAAFWSSVSDVEYEAQDLKIDVFRDVAVATWYGHVTLRIGEEQQQAQGRQTVVLVRTAAGWKIAHEHGTPRQ